MLCLGYGGGQKKDQALFCLSTYTSDPTLADFTAGVNQYATFSNFGAGDTSSRPQRRTPIIKGTARRVVGGSWMWG
jgi:hypothetical protein